MSQYSESDKIDTLTAEQLDLMARSEPSFVTRFIADRSTFDTHRIRLLLELGAIEAKRRLEALAAPMGEELPAPDEIVTALYRRFKEWSKRGFGPDDVTWCEVKADVVALISPYAERIRQLERELQTASKDGRKYQRKVDEKIMERRLQGVALLLKCSKCGADRSKEPCGNPQNCAMRGHAYIDGRTAGAAPTWQPIETAPKDGSAVLLSRADAGGSWIGKYYPVYTSGYRPDNPWFSLMLNRDYLPKPLKSSAPTHWAPLPAAPSPQQGKEGGNG
jgi:hypothetical protein